jgi:hypothetical protein
MNNPIPILSGPIAVIDMLGFEELVNLNQLQQVVNAYAHIITSATFSAEVLNVDLQFMVYSDTIAIRLVNISDKSFYGFILAIQLIAHNFFYTNLIPGYLNIPIRGAIVFGDYSWHKGDISTQVLGRDPITAKAINFIVGEAIIRAHNHEKSQKWIGISFDSKTAKTFETHFPVSFNKLIAERYLVEYPIPQKYGSVNGFAVNPTARATFHDELTAFIVKCKQLLAKAESCPDVLTKYRNTLIYLRYLFDKDFLIPILPPDIINHQKSIDTLEYDNLLKEMDTRSKS